VLQLYGNASHLPFLPTQSISIPMIQPPLIRITGTAASYITGVTFQRIHVGFTQDPCPSQQAPGHDGAWSQAWNHPTIAPDVPRGSINNPACDCLMIVGGIETGVKSTISAVYTEALSVDGCIVGPNGGSGVSVAKSTHATVTNTFITSSGGNGVEFSTSSSSLLSNSRIKDYGLVLSGAAGIELDQSPNSTVRHTEISGGIQNGGINLDCHGDCQPSLLSKNHLFNLGTHNTFGLSDGGAIHIDNSTGFVELADNKVHDIRSQNENGGGLYIDDHSTNIFAHGNLW
jgi:hypothetical protein